MWADWWQVRTQDEQDKANGKVLDKQNKRKEKIKSKGIDYEFDGHVSDTERLSRFALTSSNDRGANLA